MAIEPLGSVMTIQSQAVQKPVEIKPASGDTEVVRAEQVPNVDPATVTVQKVENKDGQNTGTGNKDTSNKDQQATNDKIKKAVERLNKNLPNSEAVFGIHDETNRVTIKIIDKDTNEILKEYPPEKTLDMIAKVWELAGILVDEKR